jgi:cysteinyl-tRNA synthetase
VEGKSVREWIEERDTAKQSRDFATADTIRETLSLAGIELRDSPEGTTWVRKPVGV